MIVYFRRHPPLLSPHAPSWTALWLQWSHSDSCAAPPPRTWRETITLSPLWKRPSRGCTTLLYIIYSSHILIFISNLHISYLYIHNCIYYILCFCNFVHCIFLHYSFIICVLSCCCHFVALWSFCHYKIFLVCVNIPGKCGNKAHSQLTHQLWQ